ncbi:hypothetical protein BH24ACT11_BH24ACT11_14230 [soil metagenome]
MSPDSTGTLEEQVEAQLAALDEMPVEQHLPAYSAIHQALETELHPGQGADGAASG